MDPAGALERLVEERCGLRLEGLKRVGTVKHVFSHRRLTASVFVAEGRGAAEARAWYPEIRVVSDPSVVPLSTLARKLLALEDARG